MYAVMLRSALAILLIFCWMLLSGCDLVADLKLPHTEQFADSAGAPSKPFTAFLASDILESAAYHGRPSVNHREWSTVGIRLFAAELPQKISKLHKLLRVFII